MDNQSIPPTVEDLQKACQRTFAELQHATWANYAERKTSHGNAVKAYKEVTGEDWIYHAPSTVRSATYG